MIKINGKMVNKDIKELELSNNQLTHLPVEIGQLTQLTELFLDNGDSVEVDVIELYDNLKENNPDLEEASMTGTGASFTAGSGAGYMTPNAFKKKKKN